MSTLRELLRAVRAWTDTDNPCAPEIIEAAGPWIEEGCPGLTGAPPPCGVPALDAAAIAFEQLRLCSELDGDESGYEVTIKDGDLLDIEYHYECGSGAVLIHLPDVREAGADLNETVLAACESARSAAKAATPW